MRFSYFESSCLAKLFIVEAASPAIRQHAASLDDSRRVISVFARTEVRSALQRRYRNGEITRDQLTFAAAQLQAAAARWTQVKVEKDVLDLADGVIERNALRSLDALQLASALHLRRTLMREEELLFIATDERLLKAATAEGIATWNPELTPAP